MFVISQKFVKKFNKMLTLEQKIFVIQCYGLGQVSLQFVKEQFTEKYGIRLSKMGISKLIKKFEVTGSVLDKKKRKKPLDEDDAATLLALDSINEDHRLSLRKRATYCGIGKTHLQRIYKENKIRPYKPKFLHTLQPGDEDKRLLFCVTLGEKILENRNYHKYIIFSDESTFTTNGVVSSQNCRHWSRDNPHFTINTKSQYYKKINVWCAISYDKVIGPYFFDTTVNQNSYLEMLQTFFWEEMENFNLEFRQNCIFQQDGCPAHASRVVCNWCNEKFGEKWIGRNGPILWPPRSPDISPLDFYLWGMLKQKIYQRDFGNNLALLKEAIREAILDIQPEELHKVYQELRNRLETCTQAGGSLFE